MKIQPHKAQNGIGKKALGDIEILHTDTLIKEVFIQVFWIIRERKFTSKY